MRITSWDKEAPYEDVNVIEIPFPDKKYAKLLKVCQLTPKSKLGQHQISQIFVNAIYHFLLGHISLDELAEIASELREKVDKKHWNTKLHSKLLDCSEFSFYVRRIYKKGEVKKDTSFVSFVNSVMEYYDSHRQAVVKEE